MGWRRHCCLDKHNQIYGLVIFATSFSLLFLLITHLSVLLLSCAKNKLSLILQLKEGSASYRNHPEEERKWFEWDVKWFIYFHKRGKLSLLCYVASFIKGNLLASVSSFCIYFDVIPPGIYSVPFQLMVTLVCKFTDLLRYLRSHLPLLLTMYDPSWIQQQRDILRK